MVIDSVLGQIVTLDCKFLHIDSYLKPYGEDKTKDPSIFCLTEGGYFQPRLRLQQANIGNIREMQIS